MNNFKYIVFMLLSGQMFHYIYLGVCWKAVPANQATYALRSDVAWTEGNATVRHLDVYLPRNVLSFTYKFGWCRPDVISSQFLRKSHNLTLLTFKDQSTNYIYIMEDKHTRRYASQCVVMKAYVNRKFLFYKSRLPLYYCQGIVLILQLRTVDRQAIHEFYLYHGLVTLELSKCEIRDFSTCHDDFSLKPPDGVLKEHTFTWLGFAQYLHVTTGLPHHSKAPRVVLIHKQFAAGTATDLLRLPKNYKLGHIVFGDYERDEEDCGLMRSQTKMGVPCPRAYIEMPYIDITPHPEYSRFGVGNSLALIKLLRPVKSHYMIPICLPTVIERKRKRKKMIVFMVDYISSVPRDFDSERMGKMTLKMYTHKDCRRHRMRTRLGSEGVTHVLCSSGCGVRPGAPIVSHTPGGTFELIGVAAGGAPCSRRSMRKRLNTEPPLYIDVFPYVSWIINVITAHVMPRPYPEKFTMVEGGSSMGIHTGFLRTRKKQQAAWKARTYVTGNYCFKSIKKQQRNTKFFYSEKFEVNADPPGKLNIIIKISAGIECTITCAKIRLPNRLSRPLIEGVGGYNITITFNSMWFPYTFYFWLGLDGKNTTQRDFISWMSERKPGFW